VMMAGWGWMQENGRNVLRSYDEKWRREDRP
jgi:hypothetical protein